MRDPLPYHWNFALCHALTELQTLVRAFDFRRLVRHHAYVGITPTFLREVIDGFLAEDESVVLPAQRTDLAHLRLLVTQQIMPAYEQGRTAGRRHWEQSGRCYGAFTVEALHD